MLVNPHFEAQVAKFEVCNTAGCFNQAYEEQKLAKALPCNNQTCF
jgi:hypothetical protein